MSNYSLNKVIKKSNSIIVNKIQNMQYAKSKLVFGVRLYTGSKLQRTAGKTLESVPSLQVLKLENHIGGFPNPDRNFFWGGRRGRAVGCYHILLQSRFSLPDDTCKLAKRKVLTLRPTSQNGPEGSLTVLMIQNSPERSIFGNSKTCFKFLFWSYGPLVANDNS